MRNVSVLSSVPRIPAEVFLWVGGVLLTLLLWSLLLREQINLLFAIVIVGTILLVSFHSRAGGAILTIGYLTIMGDVRRIVSVSFAQPRFDLLLLVAPAIAVTLALPMLLRLRLKDRLSKAMLLLLFVMILQMFNPQQGGLTVGLSGALFYIVPVLWFWIGRQLGSPLVIENLFYKCIFPLALFAAVMGICQTFIGFLPYQQTWIDSAVKGYGSLHVGGSIRAFGFSVSAAEYAVLLLMATGGAAAAYFSPKRIWVSAVPLLLFAAILSSSRTLVIKLIFALAIVWTLRTGRKLNTRSLIRLGVFTLLGLVAVFGLASRFSSDSKPTYQKGAAAQNALEHQASGLAHPLDQRSSTVGIHAKGISDGVIQGFIVPIGHGLGATTLAARKFGGDTSTGSSEIDFSDMFISLGLIGGLTYVYIIFETVRYTVRYVQLVPKEVSLPMLSILAATIGSWLIGGQYATSSLLFFLIGALVYSHDRPPVENAAVATGRNLFGAISSHSAT